MCGCGAAIGVNRMPMENILIVREMEIPPEDVPLALGDDATMSGR